MLDEIREWIRDNYWNRIYMKWNDIFLRLVDSQESRKLWWIDGNNLVVLRSSRHIMRCNNSRWFNYVLISNLDRDMWVIVRSSTKSKSYWFCRVWDIMDEGTFLHFLRQGFERQIFMRLENFSIKNI